MVFEKDFARVMLLIFKLIYLIVLRVFAGMVACRAGTSRQDLLATWGRRLADARQQEEQLLLTAWPPKSTGVRHLLAASRTTWKPCTSLGHMLLPKLSLGRSAGTNCASKGIYWRPPNSTAIDLSAVAKRISSSLPSEVTCKFTSTPR